MRVLCWLGFHIRRPAAYFIPPGPPYTGQAICTLHMCACGGQWAIRDTHDGYTEGLSPAPWPPNVNRQSDSQLKGGTHGT